MHCSLPFLQCSALPVRLSRHRLLTSPDMRSRWAAFSECSACNVTCVGVFELLTCVQFIFWLNFKFAEDFVLHHDARRGPDYFRTEPCRRD